MPTHDKETLRRLMRESKARQVINHPLARHIGTQLTCILCNTPVDELLWTSHINSKSHHARLEQVRPAASSSSRASSATEQSSSDNSRQAEAAKRIAEPATLKSSKRVRSESDTSLGVTNRRTVEAAFHPFADSGSTSSSAAKPTSASDTAQLVTSAPDSAIPEGFFDDPITDAKKRKTEPKKDKVDVEWEKFQKELTSETKTSEAVMDADDKEIASDIGFSRVEEQMQTWSKVREFEKKQDEMRRKLNESAANRTSDAPVEDGVDSDDDTDDFDTMEWRRKTLWI